ncbi:MAG TPA: hypothetical protein DCM30_00600, partial [Acinetobacter radioresistens]|nr:hypothetical protein [Acinetobacter radioresistens]
PANFGRDKPDGFLDNLKWSIWFFRILLIYNSKQKRMIYGYFKNSICYNRSQFPETAFAMYLKFCT